MALHRRAALRLVPSAALATLAWPAWAQARPLRLVVPYPPGGPLDLVARALAEKVHDSLGTVIVDNRPGAGGNLGADLVAKAAPDGNTIVMGAVATHAINPWLFTKLPYDPIRDFTPITRVAQVPNVLVMNVDAAQRLASRRYVISSPMPSRIRGGSTTARAATAAPDTSRARCSRPRRVCSWSTSRTPVGRRRNWR
jgi:tripartite-type tricarboxylate transporter receptor subunit TctC